MTTTTKVISQEYDEYELRGDGDAAEILDGQRLRIHPRQFYNPDGDWTAVTINQGPWFQVNTYGGAVVSRSIYQHRVTTATIRYADEGNAVPLRLDLGTIRIEMANGDGTVAAFTIFPDGPEYQQEGTA